MKIKMDYKWVALSVTTVGSLWQAWNEYRSGRTPNDLTEFARQHRSWNMDYHRLHAHDDDTRSHTRSIGRFVRQSQTL